MTTPDPLGYRLNVDRFRKLCDGKGWINPLQIARGIGMSHTSLYRILRGEMLPGEKFQSRATAALDVDHSELFVREQEQVSV